MRFRSPLRGAHPAIPHSGSRAYCDTASSPRESRSTCDRTVDTDSTLPPPTSCLRFRDSADKNHCCGVFGTRPLRTILSGTRMVVASKGDFINLHRPRHAPFPFACISPTHRSGRRPVPLQASRLRPGPFHNPTGIRSNFPAIISKSNSPDSPGLSWRVTFLIR